MSYTIGRHEVEIASIESSAVDKLFACAGRKARVLYTDAPWGDGNMKYWATLNRKATGAVFNVLPYQALLNRVVYLAKRYVDGHVMITVGEKWVHQVVMTMEEAGMKNMTVFNCLYRSGSKNMPMRIVYGATSAAWRFNASKFHPTDEYGAELHNGMVSAVAERGETLLDPCCGAGAIAKAALSNGMKFKGSDFNSARLKKTIEFLRSKQTNKHE